MFGSCLYFNTTALARVLDREWSKAFKPFGLTPPQAFMLKIIVDQPALLSCEVADALCVTRPTATRILDGLQKLKLIERRKTNRDGREFEIYPTAKAKALKTKINKASHNVTQHLRDKLGINLYEGVVTHMKNARYELT